MESIDTVDLAEFAKMIGLDRAAPGRYSALLTLNLLGGALSGFQNAAKVVREIELLEAGEPGEFKQPIKNRHPPLKGLWHKHYMQDGIRSLAMNVNKGLKKYRIPVFEQMIRDAEDAGEERYVSAEDIPAIVEDIVRGNRHRLGQEQALSGEWLIFASHQGLNYYLTVATHDKATHDQVRDQIDMISCQEFPFLKQLLADA